MTDFLRPVLDQIAKLWARLALMPVIRWGTVTQASPLRVTLDGDTDAVPFTPQTVVKGIPTGKRVVCIEQHRRLIIIAVTGWTDNTGWAPLTLENGWSPGDFGMSPAREDHRAHTNLHGVVKRTSGNITSSTVICVLPPDSRPGAVSYYLAQGGGLASVPIQIDADGSVRVKAAPSVTTAWVSLDNIRIDH